MKVHHTVVGQKPACEHAFDNIFSAGMQGFAKSQRHKVSLVFFAKKMSMVARQVKQQVFWLLFLESFAPNQHSILSDSLHTQLALSHPHHAMLLTVNHIL